MGLTGSLTSTELQSSSTVPTSLAQSPIANPNHNTIVAIEIGVPLAIIVILLAVLAVILCHLIRKHNLGFF